MELKLLRIRVLVWICLLSIFIWWGSESMIRYWNQPLTTNIVYTFDERGVQFPLLTFCDFHFSSRNKILKVCKESKFDYSFFIEGVTDCLKKSRDFKISTLMNSFDDKRKDIINSSLLWNGYKYTEHQNLDDQIWSRVFHPMYGACFMFDPSNIDDFKHIPYLGYTKPIFNILLNDSIPWKKIRLFLHTKNDLPDAYQFNSFVDVEVSNKTKRAYSLYIKRTFSER